MPLPTYDDFLRESLDVADAYQQAHGQGPGSTDLYHNAYRRLVEGWSHTNIIHDILGEPLEEPPEEPPAPPPEPPPVEPPPVEPPPEPPPVPVPTRHALVGRLRIAGGRICDDTGGRMVLHKHAFTMFWEWCQDRRRCRQEFFDPIAQADYQGVRVLTTVNRRGVLPWWERFGVRLSPDDTPNYYGELEAFCYELADYGLQAHFVSGGSEGWDWTEYSNFHGQVGGVLWRVEQALGHDVCDYYEVQNESGATGNPPPDQLAPIALAVMRARNNTDGLSGLSAVGGFEDRDLTTRYTPAWQQVMLVHPMREPVPQARLRQLLGHYFTWLYEDPVRRHCLCGEPGAWTTFDAGGVSGMTPEAVADLASEEGSSLYPVMQVLCRSIGTLMSDPGVTGPRHQYPFHQVPGFWTAPKLVQALEAFSRDIHTWRIGHRGRDYMRVKLVSTGDQDLDDQVRIDGMCEDVNGRSAVVMHGPAGTYQIDIGRPGRVQALHAKTDDTIVVDEWQGLSRIPITFQHGRLLLVG